MKVSSYCIILHHLSLCVTIYYMQWLKIKEGQSNTWEICSLSLHLQGESDKGHEHMMHVIPLIHTSTVRNICVSDIITIADLSRRAVGSIGIGCCCVSGGVHVVTQCREWCWGWGLHGQIFTPHHQARTCWSQRPADEGRVYTATMWALKMIRFSRILKYSVTLLVCNVKQILRKGDWLPVQVAQAYQGSRLVAGAFHQSRSGLQRGCTVYEDVCSRMSHSLHEEPWHLWCRMASASLHRSSRGFAQQEWDSELGRLLSIS